MSSDSDLDEDELLQKALREQEQRDLDYGKGRTSLKPVANYVQPPKTTNPRGNPNSTPPPKPRKPVDEDDDSEVELLSISSGDEESSKDNRAYSRNRASSAGGKDDDRGWDGGEPSRWKHVDEAEMRETKAAPVAQKFERKPSALGRKGLNNLQSFPRGMECIDPLGLGIIDNKTLRLITDASESSPSKADKDYTDNSLREKLLYFSEKFDAKLFLSRIHQDTSAADFEAGGLALKTDLKGRTQQRKQLVKENFDCFVSCKTTIDDIELKLRRIEEDPEGSGTVHLYNSMQAVSSQANHAFQPLFERQAQAEKIRSVQGMLQRFRTLFNLPSAIRGSISKGEYDLAVREYRKAKSIVLPSHVGVLKRVLEEVEKVMREFKGMLYKFMEDPQMDLIDLENTVRLLLELEPESDPVWHYLNIQDHRIRGLLEKCTSDHEVRMENLQNEIRERALSDAKWKQIQQRPNESLDVDLSPTSLLVDSQPADLRGEEVDVLRGRYIRRLTAVLTYHVPAFWKAALSVFSGKFAKSSQVSADSNVNASANKTEERIGDGKYSSHSLDEVAGMIPSTISVYEAKEEKSAKGMPSKYKSNLLQILSTFRDFEDSNILHPYMSDAIMEISKACQVFEAKESAPPIAVVALRTLHSEITKIYILRLCSCMRTLTEDASKDETWVPVSVLERNISPYTISFLPLAFRSIVTSAMDQINLMIQSLKSEATKSEDVFTQVREIQESVGLAFLNCFLDFAGHLEQLGSDLSQNRSNIDSPHLQNGYADEPQDRTSDLPGSVSDPHQRLLIVLSNIGFCKDELSYELFNKYKHIWLQSRVSFQSDYNVSLHYCRDEDHDVGDLVLSFSALEEKVLGQYTFAKASLIRTAAMNYLFDAAIEWGAAPAVKVRLLQNMLLTLFKCGLIFDYSMLKPLQGVRDAAVELLHTLVAVHAEVFAGAKPLLDKTLGILVEGLIDTFLSLFHENKSKDLRSLDPSGFCQLMLELEYFEAILNPYFTPDARESLKSLQGVLLEKATEGASETVENPGHQRRSTRGSEDALADERQQGTTVSPDDLIALAQQYSSELLQTEHERTRINTACFAESMPLESVPEPAKAAYASARGPLDSPSRNYRGSPASGSPSFSRHRR
ncbi:Exocyst complex component EXOC2/Sec5, N-terminal domain [Dillenia turbinata]|uniref:Exocyst complex component SEC5 n=1 Tax=Dillenia turbinata TaxID=194707 RepID=A0AAN8W1L7_9MAGN